MGAAGHHNAGAPVEEGGGVDRGVAPGERDEPDPVVEERDHRRAVPALDLPRAVPRIEGKPGRDGAAPMGEEEEAVVGESAPTGLHVAEPRHGKLVDEAHGQVRWARQRAAGAGAQLAADRPDLSGCRVHQPHADHAMEVDVANALVAGTGCRPVRRHGATGWLATGGLGRPRRRVTSSRAQYSRSARKGRGSLHEKRASVLGPRHDRNHAPADSSPRRQ